MTVAMKLKDTCFLEEKAMTNLDSTLKSRYITLPIKVYIVKKMIFPVVMYGCESWIIKKAEHWRIDAFEFWCWKTLLSALDRKEIVKPVNPKGSQSWIFTGRTDAKAWSSNTLTTWWEELTHWKRPIWCWERLTAGGEGDDRARDVWTASPTRHSWVWASSRSW